MYNIVSNVIRNIMCIFKIYFSFEEEYDYGRKAKSKTKTPSEI